ncbi:ABC transporter ATP-binding protein/permease [Leifsonia sp. Le1]|uniref:ABC transporter ATP-binding protein/permease n=1 Tax=Leifsonia sp. Le1 TaxID=3404918 RepID=UPI003EB717A7
MTLSESAENAVVLRSISKAFPPNRDVLSGLDFSVAPGEFVAIEGSSGGGKSTMLNIIGLLDTPDAGDYLLGSVDTRSLSRKDLARFRSDTFAFIFQSFHLLDRRPAIDSVELGLLYRGLRRTERRKRALESLASLGIESLAFTRAANLSGGERQRVAIARALASGAPIVLADEPTGNLDSESGASVVAALQQVNRSGATVVLVTHSPEVAQSARRGVVMVDGRLTERSTTGAFELPEPRPSPGGPGRPSRLRIADLIGDAFSTLASRVARSVGLVSAVALGVALAVGTMGVAQSSQAQVRDTFDAHVNRDVKAEWTPRSSQRTGETLRDIERISGVESAGLLATHSPATAQATTTREPIEVVGYSATPEIAEAARADLDWADGVERLETGHVLVGSVLAKRLQLASPDLRPVVTINSQPFVVAGTINSSSRLPHLPNAVIVSNEDSAALGRSDRVVALVVSRAGAAQQVAKQISFAIDPFLPSRVEVTAPTDPSDLRAEVEADVQSLLYVLTGISVIAAIFGLGNAMVSAVMERRQEFGLRRAIGARASHLFWQVIVEAVMLGAVGGVVGLATGVGGLLIVTIAQRWAPVFDLALAPGAVVGGIVVGSIGGMLAAISAARIRPSDALRH